MQFTQVLNCLQASLYQQKSSQALIVTCGLLRVFKSPDNLLLLRLNEFDMGVHPQQKVGSTWEESEQRWVFYLPQRDGQPQYQIRAYENAEALEQLLIYKNFSLSQGEAEMEGMMMGEAEMEGECAEGEAGHTGASPEKKKHKGISGFFVKSSKWIGDGLAKGGHAISKGFQKSGNFVASKIGSWGQVHVPKPIRKTFHFMSSGTGQVLHIGSQAVGTVFSGVKKGTIYVAQKTLPKSVSSGTSHNVFVKAIGTTVKTTVESVGNIVGGASDGITDAASGARKGAHTVVEKRYGTQVAGMTSDTVQTAVNLASIYSIPEDQAVKAVVGDAFETKDDRVQHMKKANSMPQHAGETGTEKGLQHQMSMQGEYSYPNFGYPKDYQPWSDKPNNTFNTSTVIESKPTGSTSMVFETTTSTTTSTPMVHIKSIPIEPPTPINAPLIDTTPENTALIDIAPAAPITTTTTVTTTTTKVTSLKDIFAMKPKPPPQPQPQLTPDPFFQTPPASLSQPNPFQQNPFQPQPQPSQPQTSSFQSNPFQQNPFPPTKQPHVNPPNPFQSNPFQQATFKQETNLPAKNSFDDFAKFAS